MTKLTLYQVDAFTDKLFAGNPAAVVKLERFLPDDLMQALASENNLSETAFVVPRDKYKHYDLRWFTPTLEIDFCGHATVATAHVLYKELGAPVPYHFHTQVGELIVGVNNGLYVLDAPVSHANKIDISDGMCAAFPVPLIEAFTAADNLYVVFESADDIVSIQPDMTKIIPLSDHGVGVTAKGVDNYDCISRFFVPAQGIDEDPVTGSAHAAIGPYWAKELGKTKLKAYQASKRSGDLHLNIGDERLTISGHAITYMRGEFNLP